MTNIFDSNDKISVDASGINVTVDQGAPKVYLLDSSAEPTEFLQ